MRKRNDFILVGIVNVPDPHRLTIVAALKWEIKKIYKNTVLSFHLVPVKKQKVYGLYASCDESEIWSSRELLAFRKIVHKQFNRLIRLLETTQSSAIPTPAATHIKPKGSKKINGKDIVARINKKLMGVSNDR